MSGHSKWATTKHHKAKEDQKRAGAFTKIAKMVMVAARDGADPSHNFKLRLAIDKARAVNMPKDNIDRAIKKGAGLTEGEQYYDVLYEAYGPSGAALLIEATTDNKNRTASNVRTILNKYGGSLGSTNSVQYMFKHKGVLVMPIPAGASADDLSLDLIDHGADDVQVDDNVLVIFTTVEQFLPVKAYLEEKQYPTEMAEIEYVADLDLELDEESAAKLEKIVDFLEGDDDVNKVYTNVKN
jgi:YebC/PmpR family DNA-binding regulatory protein